MSHQIKMSNTHVFCQLSTTSLRCSTVRSYERLKVKEVEITNIE